METSITIQYNPIDGVKYRLAFISYGREMKMLVDNFATAIHNAILLQRHIVIGNTINRQSRDMIISLCIAHKVDWYDEHLD